MADTEDNVMPLTVGIGDHPAWPLVILALKKLGGGEINFTPAEMDALADNLELRMVIPDEPDGAARIWVAEAAQ